MENPDRYLNDIIDETIMQLEDDLVRLRNTAAAALQVSWNDDDRDFDGYMFALERHLGKAAVTASKINDSDVEAMDVEDVELTEDSELYEELPTTWKSTRSSNDAGQASSEGSETNSAQRASEQTRACGASKLLCVDLDGTLTRGETVYWDEDDECEPDPEMVAWVDRMYCAGHHIIIHTARPWKHARDTAAWLDEHGVRYHGLRMNKGGADMYVDDKSFRPDEVTSE